MNSKYHQIVPLERLSAAIYLDLLPLYSPGTRSDYDKVLRNHCRTTTQNHWKIYPKKHRVELFRPWAICTLDREYTADEIYLLCRLGWWNDRHQLCKETGFLHEEDWLKYLNANFRRTLFECCRETRPKPQKT